jgi:hypothetical protein
MSEQWAIYWWSISENIQMYLGISGIVFLCIVPIIGMGLASCRDTEDYAWPTIKVGIIAGLIHIVLALFVPSKQDLALIFAYPYMKAGVEQAAQSETVKKLSIISTKYLDKVIADLEKANANEHK